MCHEKMGAGRYACMNLVDLKLAVFLGDEVKMSARKTSSIHVFMNLPQF
jgi:hypothetical protein